MGSRQHVALFLALLSVSALEAASAGDWNYDIYDAGYGPDNWAGHCKEPGMSPINFEKAKLQPAEWWRLRGWGLTRKWNAKNDGKTVKFELASGYIRTCGGGLGNEYDAVQFHFHWGASDTKGSEHTVSGKSYPMELHIVHARSDFKSNLTAAVTSGDSDALAVLGYFFQISERDNRYLDDLVDAVKSVQKQDTTASGVEVGSLSKIVRGTRRSDWWRYNGSLTTPGCNRIVKWTVFEKPIKISKSQMQVFRDAGTEKARSTELYRPVQKLGDRTLYKYSWGARQSWDWGFRPFRRPSWFRWRN